MDAQTSFIPKHSLDTQTRIQRADTVSIFTLLSTLVFFLAIIAGGGIFFWKYTLQNDVKAVELVLVKEKNDFDEREITELTKLDQRLTAASQLLDSRLYTSKIFQLLNANTIQTVRFAKFSVDPLLTDKNKLKVLVSGQAKDYASVALQADVFSKLTDSVLEYEFSNLTLDQSGNVLFDMNATIDKRAVSFNAQAQQIDYSQSLSNSGGSEGQPSAGGDENNPFPIN